MDSQSFRSVMRHQAGAVAIIAVGEAGRRTGLTATAVSSLSDDPPTIIACVNRGASAHDPICAKRAFSINILAREQLPVADAFSGRTGLRGEARFQSGTWSTLVTGAPTLEGALATLDCTLEEQIEAKTHSIFIGRVRDGRFCEVSAPLLYFRGDYWDLARS